MALEAAHKGWARASSSAVGPCRCRDFDPVRSSCVTGRALARTAFGGAKSRTRLCPKIVDWYMAGKIEIPMDHPTSDADQITEGLRA